MAITREQFDSLQPKQRILIGSRVCWEVYSFCEVLGQKVVTMHRPDCYQLHQFLWDKELQKIVDTVDGPEKDLNDDGARIKEEGSPDGQG